MKVFGMTMKQLVERVEDAEKYGDARIHTECYEVIEFDGISVYYDYTDDVRGDACMVIADGKVLTS